MHEIYSRLKRSEKCRFREIMMKECGWAYGTFYYKLKHHNFSKLEKQVVQDICLAFLP